MVIAWSGVVPLDAHIKAVREASRASGVQPLDDSRDVLPHFSLRALSEELQRAKDEHAPIAVLHLLCHGGQMGSNCGLIINGDEDTLESRGRLDGGRLGQLLGQHADMVRLVVFMACDSSNQGLLGSELGSVAQAVHRSGISSVVASRFPLSKSGSIRLAKKLYSCLIPELTSLEDALLAARVELAKADLISSALATGPTPSVT